MWLTEGKTHAQDANRGVLEGRGRARAALSYRRRTFTFPSAHAMQRALQCFTNARAKFEARKPGGGEGAPYYRQIAEAEAAKEREEAQQRMAWCVGLLVGILILGGLIWGGWYAFILHGASTEVAEPEVGAGAAAAAALGSAKSVGAGLAARLGAVGA